MRMTLSLQCETYKNRFQSISYFILFQLNNRRSKYVRPQEKDKWEDIGASCMTEESDDDDQGYVLHRPCWRSDDLSNLIKNLDKRDGIARSQQDHPPLRRPRVVGEPTTSRSLSYLPSWAVSQKFHTQVRMKINLAIVRLDILQSSPGLILGMKNTCPYIWEERFWFSLSKSYQAK